MYHRNHHHDHHKSSLDDACLKDSDFCDPVFGPLNCSNASRNATNAAWNREAKSETVTLSSSPKYTAVDWNNCLVASNSLQAPWKRSWKSYCSYHKALQSSIDDDDDDDDDDYDDDDDDDDDDDGGDTMMVVMTIKYICFKSTSTCASETNSDNFSRNPDDSSCWERKRSLMCDRFCRSDANSSSICATSVCLHCSANAISSSTETLKGQVTTDTKENAMNVIHTTINLSSLSILSSNWFFARVRARNDMSVRDLSLSALMSLNFIRLKQIMTKKKKNRRTANEPVDGNTICNSASLIGRSKVVIR